MRLEKLHDSFMSTMDLIYANHNSASIACSDSDLLNLVNMNVRLPVACQSEGGGTPLLCTPLQTKTLQSCNLSPDAKS